MMLWPLLASLIRAEWGQVMCILITRVPLQGLGLVSKPVFFGTSPTQPLDAPGRGFGFSLVEADEAVETKPLHMLAGNAP